MNKEEIKKILPHREPMLLVDEVELIDGKAFGKCHIRGDEYFLQGHFPGNPIVPGVIQCEMLAQSACVLLADGASEGMTPVFTSLDKVKFRGMVKPGDTLLILGDEETGIIVTKPDVLRDAADEIFGKMER